MIVNIKNLSQKQESVPTPANTSFLLAPNETATFIWPAIDKATFENLTKNGFEVETITQFSDIHLKKDSELNLKEFGTVATACEGLILATAVCDDEGAHVSQEEQYTTSEARTALLTALEKALADVQKAEDQGAVDSAKSELESAKITFESTLQSGTMIED